VKNTDTLGGAAYLLLNLIGYSFDLTLLSPVPRSPTSFV
jgi:hypothetical protein